MSAALAHLHVAAALIIIAWDVWLTNRIAGARMLPRRFVGITGLAGLLLIPAVIVALATGSLEYGRALAAVAWLWPLTLVLFAIQAWYATLRGFVTPAMGVPIALYDSLIAGAALVQLVVRWGVQPPSIFVAVLAADYGALAATASPLALSSSLLFYVPLFAPAFPARYRASATVRVLLAAAAAVWGGIIIAKIWPASGAVRGYDRYDAVRMRERPEGDLAIGVKLFPQLRAGPPPVAIREDVELVDSLTPDVIAVTIAPDGVKRATLDSIAHVLEPVRRDSTVFVVTLGNGAQPIFAGSFGVARTAVGSSIGEFYVRKTDGIFQSAAEVAASCAQKNTAQPGDIRYVDLNGDCRIDDADRYNAGNAIPKLDGGLFWDAHWHAFDAKLGLHGSFGAKIFNATRFWAERTDENNNHFAGFTPWTPTNHSTTTPRAVFGGAGAANAFAQSDRWLESGNYVRIQNLEFGFRLPSNIGGRYGLNTGNSRLYFAVQNLHTFTNYTGYDPEVIGQGDILARGIDDGRIYPNARTFTIGVNIAQ